MNPENKDKLNDDGIKPFGFGSIYSPFLGNNLGDDQNRNNLSVYSNNRGSIHNMFWRSPVGFGFPNESPLAWLIRPRNRDTPLNLEFNSPSFAQNQISFHGLEYNQPLFEYANRSHEVSQVMSSLDEDSVDSNPKKIINQKLNPKGGTLILNKDLEVESKQEVTIENIEQDKSANMFGDLESKPSAFTGVALKKPQIEDEVKQRKVEEKKVEVKQIPFDMPMPKKKKQKLAKKKRSKSWDEEAAKQEQLKRKNQEKRRGSLAVRKDVVNKTLLRSMKRLITQKFETESGINDLSNDEKKNIFLKMVDRFTKSYFPSIWEIQNIEDNEDESVLSQDGVKFIVGLIVSQQLMRSHINTIKERTFFYQYYQLLNKYSHK